MPKFIIWDGQEYTVEDCKNADEAAQLAYERWLEGADQDYKAEPYSKDLAKEYGLEDEDD